MPVCYQLREAVNKISTSPSALRLGMQYAYGFTRRQCRLIRAAARHGLIHIDDANDLREHRNLIAAQSIGIAGPIEALVVVTDDWSDGLERAKMGADAVARDGMGLDQVQFFV